MTARTFVITSALVSFVACGGKPQAPQPSAEASGVAEPTNAEPTPPANVEPPVEPTTPAAQPEATPEVVAVPTEPTPTPAPTPAPRSGMPGSLSNPLPATVAWAELPGLDDIDDFEPLVLGVLTECMRDDGDYCELDASGKLVTSKLDGDIFPEDLFGAWPDNAWRLETKQDSVDVGDDIFGEETLISWNWTGSKWAKHDERTYRFDTDGDYAIDRIARPSWSGGLIVCHPADGKAFNELAPETILASFPPGEIWALSQTETGKLLPLRHVDGEEDGRFIRASEPCLGDDCKRDESGHPIHLGGEAGADLLLRLDVSRGGDAMTLLFEELGEPRQALLHYDPAGGAYESWHYDEIEGSTVKGMWGSPDGGLWLTISVAELLYRTPAGVWLSVAPPEGLVFESFANRSKPRELLARVSSIGSGSKVFAARGKVEPAPPEPPVPTPNIEAKPAEPAAPAAPAAPAESE